MLQHLLRARAPLRLRERGALLHDGPRRQSRPRPTARASFRQVRGTGLPRVRATRRQGRACCQLPRDRILHASGWRPAREAAAAAPAANGRLATLRPSAVALAATTTGTAAGAVAAAAIARPSAAPSAPSTLSHEPPFEPLPTGHAGHHPARRVRSGHRSHCHLLLSRSRAPPTPRAASSRRGSLPPGASAVASQPLSCRCGSRRGPQARPAAVPA